MTDKKIPNIIYTVPGCNLCKETKKRYKKFIDDGTIEVINCDPGSDMSNQEFQEKCVMTTFKDDFNGFPYLEYDNNE